MNWKLAVKFILSFGSLNIACGKHHQEEPAEVVEFRKPRPQEQKPEEPIESQVLAAIIAGDLATLRTLVPQRHPVDAPVENTKTGLWLAVENGRSSVVALFIELGADPQAKNSAGMSLSDLALEKGFRRIYWLLRPEETRQLTSELLAAIESSEFSRIRRVLEQEFDINFHFEDGESPLTKTIQLQCLRCLQVVLNQKYRVDPEFPNRAGRTPLQIAQEVGTEKIIEFVQVAIERNRDEKREGI